MGARALARLPALALVAALSVTGCGSGDEEPTVDGSEQSSPTSQSSSQESPQASPSQSTDVDVPPGITLTDPGSRLSFGDTARVAYEVPRRAEGGKKGGKKGGGKDTDGTVLGLTVESAVKGKLSDFAGFNLTDRYQKRANYYYVRVTVKNLGERRFGDVDVPLWGISGENTLLPPVRFTSAFARCPTEALPPGFKPGARFQTCLVFLSPDKGSLEGVSYRPSEDFTPIEWHGKVVTPKSEGDQKRRGRTRDRG